MSVRTYFELARPFTLVAPVLGIATGALTAWGAHRPAVDALALIGVCAATIAAALLNAGSNALNQIADLEIDRINKPHRPLPEGRIALGRARAFAAATYVLALTAAFAVSLWVGALFLGGALLSAAYSIGPRTKRSWILANTTIALARGLLLKVAGWATLIDPIDAEPWWIGAIFGLYTFGAINTKDFADVEGDRALGIKTAVITLGPARTAWLMAPFFVLPFLAIPALSFAGVLSGDRLRLSILGLGLALWGAYTARLALTDPKSLARENHPSWRHMYLIMFVLQIGFALAYL